MSSLNFFNLQSSHPMSVFHSQIISSLRYIHPNMLSKYVTLPVCHPLVCHLTVVYDNPSILPLPQNVTIEVPSKNNNGRMTVL